MIKFYWSIISKLSKPWKETNPLLYWKGISNFVVKNVFRPDFIYSMMKVQLQWATTTAGAVTQGPGSWAPSARGRGGLEGVLVVCDDLMVRCGEEYFQSCPGERWRVWQGQVGTQFWLKKPFLGWGGQTPGGWPGEAVETCETQPGWALSKLLSAGVGQRTILGLLSAYLLWGTY